MASTFIRGVSLLFLAAGLAACGSGKKGEPTAAPGDTAIPTIPPLPAVPTGPAVPAAFAACASCHSTEPGKNGVGPSLAGVYGARAAGAPGYAYSEVLRQSGLTWDDATLDKWLTSPMTLVPGTRMTFAGLSDPARRQQVIAYLKALK